MKSLILIILCSLPSTFSSAIQARQQNTSATPATNSFASTPIVPPPDQFTQADVAPNCARWDRMVIPGPFRCTDIIALYPETTFAELTLWNPSVGPLCDNVWDYYWFCTAISGPYIPLPEHLPAGIPITASPGLPQSGSLSAPTCDRWDYIPPNSSCQTFMSRYPGLSLLDLQTWNPDIVREAHACFLNFTFYLCTSIVNHVFPTPSPVEPPLPTPPTGAPAPAPTQLGVIPACMAWDKVEVGKGCATLMSTYGVTLAQLVLWNPAIEDECTNLWAAYAVCVGV